MSIFRNIRELLRERGATTEDTAIEAVEVTARYPGAKTSFALHIMHRDGLLGRIGTPRAYSYWVAREPLVRKRFKTEEERAAHRAKQEERRRRARGTRPMAEYRAEQAARKAERLAREAAEKAKRQAERKVATPVPKPKPKPRTAPAPRLRPVAIAAPAPKPVAKPVPAAAPEPVRASANRPASQQPSVKRRRRRKGQDIVIPPSGYATPAPQPKRETVAEWMERTGKKPERIPAAWEQPR